MRITYATTVIILVVIALQSSDEVLRLRAKLERGRRTQCDGLPTSTGAAQTA